MVCENCGKRHNGSFGSGRFCSKSCSKSRVISEEQKRTVSQKLTKVQDKFCMSCGRKLSRYRNAKLCKTCFCKSKTGLGKYGITTLTKKDYNAERKKILRSQAIEICGGKCIKCGYSKYNGALHFHHRNPEEKLFKLDSKAFGRSKESVEKEIQKCDLLCANCHSEAHSNVTDTQTVARTYGESNRRIGTMMVKERKIAFPEESNPSPY